MQFACNSTIIKKENNYFLQRKLLTIHANDRDKAYYKLPNQFEVKCPESYTNIESMKINEISFPSKPNNFSSYLNNNTLSYDSTLITIPDGFYTQSQLANTLQTFMGSDFHVKYIIPENKFIFMSINDFSIHTNISDSSCNNNNFTKVYPKFDGRLKYAKSKNLYKFNLLYHLGFDLGENESISSIKDTSNNINKMIDYYTNSTSGLVVKYYIKATSCERFIDEQPIYMELKKYSVFDELNPFPVNSSNLYNNHNNGSINTAILKIPPKNTPIYSEAFDENNAILYFDPPLERISNFAFKFRYHDGRLIDIENQDLNFTLEINQLRNDINNKRYVNTNSSLN